MLKELGEEYVEELDRATKLYQKLRNEENNILFGEDNLTNNKRLKQSNNKKINSL